MSCPSNGSRTLQLWYEGLEDFFYNCGSSVTFGTASGKLPSARMGENDKHHCVDVGDRDTRPLVSTTEGTSDRISGTCNTAPPAIT
ncbi:hypothetical protein ACFX2H_009794 [Malus domestica]